MKCGYLYDWIKKMVTYAKISPKMVKPRVIAGNTEEKEDQYDRTVHGIVGLCGMSEQSVSLTCVIWQLLLLVGCLASQQHASVSQGWTCSDNFACCHTEIEVAGQTFHLTQSQYTDTGPTSPSTDPITPGTWQGSDWSANLKSLVWIDPEKNPSASRIRTWDLSLSRRMP